MGAAAASRPRLVAHRGYPLRHPENSLAGLRAALEAGAELVEFDVQQSADGVPVLLHDIDLRRTAGVAERVVDLPAAELRRHVPALREALELLSAHRDAAALVEVKPESLEHFGREAALERVLPILRPWAARVTVISTDIAALGLVRRRAGLPIGWILPDGAPAAVRARAAAMRPDLLVCSRRRLPPEGAPLWPGPWRWAVYTVDDADEARRLFARGAALVETDAIVEMIAALGPDHD
jgi:glycerophosphoryl diester phosphodiesterase